MSVYQGEQIISYLSAKINQPDEKSSSHWNKYHKDFGFYGNRFSGVKGFGNNEKQYSGLKKAAHLLLQIPFRRMGLKYDSFIEIDQLAKTILKRQNKAYSLDVLRQVITLSYLNQYNSVAGDTTCVIGDGFATMSSLLLGYNNQRVILVNLTKTLLVDIWYLKLYLRDQFNSLTYLITDSGSLNEILEKTIGQKCIVAIEAQNHELIQQCPIDLAINIASMQEMNPDTVVEYFQDLKKASKYKSSIFYCCNRKEKILPDGVKVRFCDYPWELCDKILMDELCPWHQKYYNLKPLFYHNYDGVMIHRLAKFSSN